MPDGSSIVGHGADSTTAVKGRLKATHRTGKTPEQLAELSKKLKRSRGDQVTLSQTAKIRLRIDNALHELVQPSMDLAQMLLVMVSGRISVSCATTKKRKSAKRSVRKRAYACKKAMRSDFERSEREAQYYEMPTTMLAMALPKK
ncbi:hypothetical protein PHYPSEUDO_006235 [Phytophthora pseudosyringae]|uniref:Uncharacterized protein n=1 Tax=Phytophthora pseudosyringae TaxID=221518 RepID=A0A8T1VM77_9STRA|nr:hypothetical protein PHYPSEUDO_006235 [Phytophthora pseudosyringae]